MATYIPGVTDYIPQIQPFQPDYNFLGNILQTRQSRYDAAHKQLSSVYGTLLNSPMLRDENIKKRDEFFKSIDGDIKRIAGLDLSLKQNQDAAMQVFKPFYEDKDMVKDMAWTKNYHNQLSRAEQFKYCVDPEKCGGQYWEGGIKALQYRAQEFKNASKEEAANMGNVSFTPSVNVMDKAMKAAKDAGFKVSFDSVKGGYIVTDKNGERMVAPLKDFFLSKFGGDPAVMDYYKTQAYIQRKDFIASNAGAMGGEDKASLAYMNNVYQSMTEKIEKAKQDAEKNNNRTGTFKARLDQKIKEKGVLPTDKSTFDLWLSLDEQHATTTQAKDVTKTAGDNLNATRNFLNNARALGDHLDNLVGFSMLTQEVSNAAKAYADLTSEREIKADPYSLAAYQSNLDFQKQAKLKGMDLEIWKQKEVFKAAQIKAQADKEFQGRFNGDLPGSKGQATDVTDPDMARTLNEKKITDLYNGQKASSAEFVGKVANQLKNQYQEYAKDPIKQNTLVATAEMIFQGTGIDGKKIANGDRAEMLKLQSLDLGSASKAYEQAVKNIDPSGTTGSLNSDWTKDFWYKTADQRHAVNQQKLIRGEYQKFLEEQSANVTEAVSGDLKAKDPVTGNQKEALLRTMVELNHNGFLPSFAEGSTSLKNIAHEFANKHQKEMGGWANAYSFALSNADDVGNAWYNGYKSHAKAFNQADGFGKIANAKMGGGYSYTYDSAVPSHNNTVRLAELMNNAHNIEGAAIVQFGDAGTIKGNDPLAKAVFDQFYTDFMNVDLKHPKEGRPKGSYSVQRIGGGDDKYMAFTFTPDENWIARYKGSGDKPRLTGTMAPGQPVTVFIPANMADNSYYKDTEYNDYDFLLNRRGKLSINDYPGAGNVNIEKVGNQIQISANFKAIDEKGQEQIIKFTDTKSGDFDASVLYQTLSQELATLEKFNDAQLDAVRHNMGTRDMGEFMKMLEQTTKNLGQ